MQQKPIVLVIGLSYGHQGVEYNSQHSVEGCSSWQELRYKRNRIRAAIEAEVERMEAEAGAKKPDDKFPWEV